MVVVVMVVVVMVVATPAPAPPGGGGREVSRGADWRDPERRRAEVGYVLTTPLGILSSRLPLPVGTVVLG